MQRNVSVTGMQPIVSCCVVLPATGAEGWLWLHRIAEDEVLFSVHARNWPNTALKSVHIHPGARPNLHKLPLGRGLPCACCVWYVPGHSVDVVIGCLEPDVVV